ncbi:bifunctional metallophosphatase/5'-nucleotidase [Geobacillus sp. NFOSA3]|uniref:Bifunctional metallophosphatase/5'-nucleotidase n=1 Tax=Parageobacillus galactosidasius TaxID=883812 RepID=A0A226QJV3_9BACL|nr:5'-nucleotidase C-terminal domain-containing protein [Parageobacillus galactosidasius]NNU92758.1 bifunctional metallophosphatase/5'-nucleotidase [Geobacillus sp. NFOSA3]OXB91712.1 bifunctional metallophosphatase/5'-nucleotidase [Parageobacillus galactosidasius]
MKLSSKLVKTTVSALALSAALSSASVFAAGQPDHLGKKQQTNSYSYRYIDVQLLGINDFHGQLDVTRNVGGRAVGRADYLAAYLKQRERENKNTLLVHAGDAVGASSPVSALLQDEPTIEFLNKLGFDVGVPGNHEFDEGVDEMLRLIYGGTHPKTGYFRGADFPYVSANVIDKKTGKPILPPYVIKKVKGIPIGFIGVTLSDTPSIVIPSGVAGVAFTDEAEAINEAVKQLKRRGVRAIVVLAHNPGVSNKDGSNASGEIVDIAKTVDDEVDVIFAGHNHAYLNAEVDGKLLVQSYSYGTAFSDVDLTIDRRTKDVVAKKAEIVTTYQDSIKPDPKITKFIDKYEAKVSPIINQVIGMAKTTISAEQNASGESALGNLIADAQRTAMKTDFAFMNPGGIRANIEQGEVTWGELYNVQPFSNQLVKMTLTGEQIRKLLNQQWQSNQTRMLQISGLTYTWDASKPTDKVVDIYLPNGAKLDPNAEYTVTANSFLADGGDNFTVFTEGKNREVGPVDLEALIHYIQQLPQPFDAQIEGRIQQLR